VNDGFGRNCLLVYINVWYRNTPPETEENLKKKKKNFIQDSWPPDRDLNPKIPEFKARVLKGK
jgi:hypothetical protein